MRRPILSTMLSLASAFGSAHGAEVTDAIYIWVSNVKTAVLLKSTEELLGRKSLLDPKFVETQVTIRSGYPGNDAFFAHVASILGTVARHTLEATQIGDSAAEVEVAAAATRENNCPYRYPDIQAAITSMLPQRLRICQPLEYFSLQSLRIAGIIGKGSTYRAIVVTPDGFAATIKAGDYMGHDFGKVFRISRSGLQLREVVQDKDDEWVERSLNLPVR